MLIFWNLAGVPMSYCHCALFLANHHPSEYKWNPITLAAFYVLYFFVYWVWDTTNSQKNGFRAQERNQLVNRKTFPQLPWQTVKNPKTITSSKGDVIMVDGWLGYARKIHYSCDIFFALSWGLITGFKSPFPWFYSVFFTIMAIHRANRDARRCREKYGEAWAQYEHEVPYLYIPVSFTEVRNMVKSATDLCAVRYLGAGTLEITPVFALLHAIVLGCICVCPAFAYGFAFIVGFLYYLLYIVDENT